MKQIRDAYDEIGKINDSITFDTPKHRRNDPEYENLMGALHRESNNFRKDMSRVMKQIGSLEKQNKTSNHDDGDDGEVDPESVNIDEQITALREKADEIWEKCKHHSTETHYSHYVQLQLGCAPFYKALAKFLQPQSKRPHGPLEFTFNNGLEYIGGGKFNAEHGGFEQTNGKAMNSLERFDDIATACEVTYPEGHRLHDQVKAYFAKFRVLAAKLFALTKLMKSQKKIDPADMDYKVIEVMLAWNDTFPGKAYFNKLHFVMVHLPEFVHRYHICGRASGESHESVHCMINRMKDAVKRMASVTQMFKTLYARCTSNLKPGIAERNAKVAAKMSGPSRGGEYKNRGTGTKLLDEVETVCSIFGDKVMVAEEEFTNLVWGGRIHSKFVDIFLIAKAGKVPDEWATGFAQSRLFSVAKLEQSQYTPY